MFHQTHILGSAGVGVFLVNFIEFVQGCFPKYGFVSVVVVPEQGAVPHEPGPKTAILFFIVRYPLGLF